MAATQVYCESRAPGRPPERTLSHHGCTPPPPRRRARRRPPARPTHPPHPPRAALDNGWKIIKEGALDRLEALLLAPEASQSARA